jgi:hypothetical protein
MDTFGLSKGAFHDRDTIAHGKPANFGIADQKHIFFSHSLK